MKKSNPKRFTTLLKGSGSHVAMNSGIFSAGGSQKMDPQVKPSEGAKAPAGAVSRAVRHNPKSRGAGGGNGLK